MSTEGAARRTAPRTVTVVAAASTAESLAVQDTYITVCAVGGDLTLIFGDSTVAAADANDWPLAQGEKESFYVSTGSNYVSIAGAGALHWYVG